MRTERKGEEVSLSGQVIKESTSFGLELPKTDIHTPSALESVPHQLLTFFFNPVKETGQHRYSKQSHCITNKKTSAP